MYFLVDKYTRGVYDKDTHTGYIAAPVDRINLEVETP